MHRLDGNDLLLTWERTLLCYPHRFVPCLFVVEAASATTAAAGNDPCDEQKNDQAAHAGFYRPRTTRSLEPALRAEVDDQRDRDRQHRAADDPERARGVEA